MGDVFPVAPVQAELEVKRSRFICYVEPVSDRQQALAFVEELRRRFPAANHHCWAYRLSEQAAACSDDGEPKGTAGRPILAQLQHRNLCRSVAVVVRFFGGTKLGTGGLVRAYGGAAREACDLLQVKPFVPQQQLEFHCHYQDERTIQHLLAEHGGELVDISYQADIKMQVMLPEPELPAFQQQLEVSFGITVDLGAN